jgi:hypothetical protein
MEADEVPDNGGAMPFPGEDTFMSIYDGHPSPGMLHVSDPGPGAPAHCGWGFRDIRS